MDCLYCNANIENGREWCTACGNCLLPIEIDWREIWSHYIRQEKNLLDFFEYVPLNELHYEVFSPKLFDIYFQIGAGIEQQLKYITGYFQNGDDHSVYENIRDSLTTINPFLHLEKCNIEIKYSKTQFDPFDELNFDNRDEPIWQSFKVYSKYKHEWIKMIRQVTLLRTTKFLGAYFILMCLNPLHGNYEFLREIDKIAATNLGHIQEMPIHGWTLSSYREYIKKGIIPFHFYHEEISYESELFFFSHKISGPRENSYQNQP